jgi:hypothetical protein
MAEPFSDFIERIRGGSEEGWNYFDLHLPEQLKDENFQKWGRNTSLVGHPNEHVRDAAATVLAHSDFSLNGSKAALSEENQQKLIDRMEKDENEFVRFWLANALYRRGNRDSRVVAMWELACSRHGIPVGEFARKLAA